MKNRNAVLHKLNQMESTITHLNMFVNQNNKEKYYETLDKLKQQLDQCVLYIESEPFVGPENY